MSSNKENKEDDAAGAEGGKEEDKQDNKQDQATLLESLFARLGVKPQEPEEGEKPEQLLDEVTFEGVAKYIQDQEHRRRIMVMTGAGISTAAGIPDFRSAGTGLYDNLQKYDLPHPQAIFEIGFFRSNPEPFFVLAKELYPGNFKPTVSHYFIKLLNDKGLLLRNYTQNVDTLERIAGIPDSKLVEAHGSFHTAHCLECRKEFSHKWVRDEVFADKIPKCPECEGVVKPDIVFFGESLPQRFHQLLSTDLPQCDLLIVMGTSLKVQPFASLVDRVADTTPRLLINKEKCGQQPDFFQMLMGIKSGFLFDSKDNYRDVMWQGTTDDGCIALADLLGWKEELLKLVETEHKRIDDAEKVKQQEPSAEAAKAQEHNPSGEAATAQEQNPADGKDDKKDDKV